MQDSPTTETMGRRRALLTDRERELISDEKRDDEHYVAISRVRTKIKEELPQDLEIMKQNHPELYKELKEEVCNDE